MSAECSEHNWASTEQPKCPYCIISDLKAQMTFSAKAWAVENERLQAELAALREQTRWVPVTERLPYINIPLLIRCHEWKHTFCAFLSESGKWYLFGTGSSGSEEIQQRVSHWMPLPPAPEVE